MAISRIQSAAGGTGTNSGNGSFTITFGGNVTAGNYVVITTVTAGGSGYAMKVSGTGYIPQKVVPPTVNGNIGVLVDIFWGIVTSGSTSVFTVANVASGDVMCGVAAEYIGSNLTQDVLATANTGNNNVPSVVNTNVTANALLIGALATGCTTASVNTSWLSSPHTPFSIANQISTNVNTSRDRAMALLDAVVSSTNSQTSSGTNSFGAQEWAGNFAIFKELASSSGGGLRAAGHGGLAA